MQRNLHIRVNGFDIYLGVNKSEKKKQQQLKSAYKNQLMRENQARTSFKSEYDLARLY